MRFSISIFILCLLAAPIFAQQNEAPLSELKIGQWRQHLPWQRANYVTQSAEKVYFASEWGVLELDKTDRNVGYLTKVEGLSDIGMGIIRYSKTAETLVLTYSTSNIDLIKGDEIVNLPVISKNPNIIGDKKIYDLAFEGDLAYFACGFGLMVLDLVREEVVSTTFTPAVARTVNLYNGEVLIGTEDGLFSIAQNDNNPEDFDRWRVWGAAEGLPAGYQCYAIGAQNDQLFLGLDKSVVLWKNSQLDTVFSNANFPVVYITTEGTGVVMGFREGFTGRVVYRHDNGFVEEIQYGCDAVRPLYCIEDESKIFWFADFGDDFMKYDLNVFECERLRFNSPYNHKVKDIVLTEDKVFITTPGPKTSLDAPFIRDGVFILEAGEWRRLDGGSNPELLPDQCNFDLWRLAVRPSDQKIFIGSFVGGLVELGDDDKATCYTQYSSLLQNAGASGTTLTAIGGLAFDQDNNLWISNFSAQKSLAVLKPDGTFKNFNTPANPLLQMAVDGNGYKWVVLGFNNGILVYDSGNDIDNPGDDRSRILNAATTILPINTINCLTIDRSGDVWVGTQQGVVSFECGSNIFDTECRGSRRIVEVDGFNGYLLETEDVLSIAVDGADRKWFGTSNGIFVQSPNGEELIAQYNTTNSPLFDNTVNAITINPRNGEVWVGTEKGVQSFRTDATQGTAINSLNVYAYPNPVRPDYVGPIAIYGLATDANVKITDVSGQLVYETKANGGQAIWNGQDYLGREAASGVYLVFSTSEANFDTPDAVVTKIVVVR